MEDVKTQAPPTAEQQFLSELRAATGDRHKALEATPLSTKLVSKGVTEGDYANYLLHMQGVIAFCEERVFPVTEYLFSDMEERSKLSAIEADIEVLDGKAKLPAAVPPYTPSMPQGDVAFALGYMYVIEGSTLGGRMLLNHVKSVLGFDEHKGARFFAGYGADTGQLWKEFLRVLSGYAVTNNCTGRIVAGARAAFTDIEHHFAQTS